MREYRNNPMNKVTAAFTLDPRTIKALKEEAKKQDRSVSKLVDMILAEKLQA